MALALTALKYKQPVNEQSVTELVSCLRPESFPVTPLESIQTEFRASLSVSEKCRVMLGLCSVLSGTYQQVEATQMILYYPVRRQLFRDIVNDLFGTGNTPVFNDWLLARCAEEIVAAKYEMPGLHTPGNQGAATKEVTVEINSTLGSAKAYAKKWYSRATDLVLVGDMQGTGERKIGTFDITDLNDRPALHTTIAVSGWLSEADDPNESWTHLIEHPHQGKVLGLVWEAGTKQRTVLQAVKHVAMFLWPIAGVLHLLRNHPFREASFRADAAGKALANCIRNRDFGPGTVSLIGFSLGTRVIFSCLEELAREDQVYLHDVVLLGGAAPAEAAPWCERRRAIAGRLVNVYSSRDKVLSIVYRVAKIHRPVGNGPINAEIVENFDASSYVATHQDHRKYLDRTLETIRYQP